MRTFDQVLSEASWFPGELEAVEAEMCGRFPTPLWRLPRDKAKRLHEYLGFAPELRQAAFEAVSDWANSPIAAALDRLRDPAKAAANDARKARPATIANDRTTNAIAEFLADDGEGL